MMANSFDLWPSLPSVMMYVCTNQQTIPTLNYPRHNWLSDPAVVAVLPADLKIGWKHRNPSPLWADYTQNAHSLITYRKMVRCKAYSALARTVSDLTHNLNANADVTDIYIGCLPLRCFAPLKHGQTTTLYYNYFGLGSPYDAPYHAAPRQSSYLPLSWYDRIDWPTQFA